MSDIVISSKRVKSGDIFFCNIAAERFLDDEVVLKCDKIFVNIGFYERNYGFKKNNKITEIGKFNDKLVSDLKERYKIPKKLIAITGTKGKTSSCWYTFHLLRMVSDKKILYFGSIGLYIGDKNSYRKIRDIRLTTPSIDEIYQILDEAEKEDVYYAVFEASSHALDQGRLEGLHVDIASFTNLKHDHLDYFKDLQEVLDAKSILFTKYLSGDFAVINKNIPEYNYLKRCSTELNRKVISYGKGGDFNLISIVQDGVEQLAEYEFKGINYKFKTKIFGKFQIENLLNACAIVFVAGFSHDKIFELLPYISAPKGRMELISSKDDKFIFVDYSHTADSMFEALKLLNDIKSNKIITVFGCGGDRDRIKRPVMTYVSSILSDFSILTSDNPRTENQEVIFQEMISAINNEIEKNKNFDYVKSIQHIEKLFGKYEKLKHIDHKIEFDRRKAIEHGISLMQKGDILLITGKGHEEYQIIGEKKTHFSDQETVLDFIS